MRWSMWVTPGGDRAVAGEVEPVEQADVTCVMEEAHRRHIREHFGEIHAEKVIVLDIPDYYVCWEDKLILLLKGKLRTALGLTSSKR